MADSLTLWILKARTRCWGFFWGWEDMEKVGRKCANLRSFPDHSFCLCGLSCFFSSSPSHFFQRSGGGGLWHGRQRLPHKEGARGTLWKEQLKLSLKSQKRRIILWQSWIKMLHSPKSGDSWFSKCYSNCWIKIKSKADENHPPKMQWQFLVIVSP